MKTYFVCVCNRVHKLTIERNLFKDKLTFEDWMTEEVVENCKVCGEELTELRISREERRAHL